MKASCDDEDIDEPQPKYIKLNSSHSNENPGTNDAGKNSQSRRSGKRHKGVQVHLSRISFSESKKTQTEKKITVNEKIQTVSKPKCNKGIQTQNINKKVKVNLDEKNVTKKSHKATQSQVIMCNKLTETTKDTSNVTTQTPTGENVNKNNSSQTLPSMRLLNSERVSKCRLNKIRTLEILCDKLTKENKQLKSEKVKSKKEQVIEYVNQNFPPETANFISQQVRLLGVKKKAERYTNKEKEVALSLLYVSAKCYKLLRKIFRLPSKSTLKKWVQDIPSSCGISQFILASLKKRAETMPLDERVCTLVLDEIKLSPGLRYDKYRDIIDGFEDYGEFGRTAHCADHALVLMVRGLKGTWKQTFAYYLCQSSVNGTLLKEILLNAIGKCVSLYLLYYYLWVYLCPSSSQN